MILFTIYQNKKIRASGMGLGLYFFRWLFARGDGGVGRLACELLPFFGLFLIGFRLSVRPTFV